MKLEIKGGTVLLDDRDSLIATSHMWHLRYPSNRGGRSTYYAKAMIDGKWKLMHRLIMKAPEGMEVDHKNGNGLDNRRENLRLCTHAENCRNAYNRHLSDGDVDRPSFRAMKPYNTSGFRGVSLNKNGKWSATIKIKGKTKYLGSFDSPETASAVYNAAFAALGAI